MLTRAHSGSLKKAAAPAVQTDRERRLIFDPAKSSRFALAPAATETLRTIQDR
jgi:hypothetical protein